VTEWRKRYCLNVFGSGYRPGRLVKATKTHGAYTQIVPCAWGIQGWNHDNRHEPGRLPDSGCFTWMGIIAVRKAAMEYLARPSVTQVSVRTNQDKQVYRYFRKADGTITGYAGNGD
jgi:hypothetical protein